MLCWLPWKQTSDFHISPVIFLKVAFFPFEGADPNMRIPEVNCIFTTFIFKMNHPLNKLFGVFSQSVDQYYCVSPKTVNTLNTRNAVTFQILVFMDSHSTVEPRRNDVPRD